MRRRALFMIAGAALVAVSTAFAGPGPTSRPTTTTMKLKAPPVHVSVPAATTLPGGRYPWAYPVFLPAKNGLFEVLPPAS